MKGLSVMLTNLLSMGTLYQLTNSALIPHADLDLSPTGLISHIYMERDMVFDKMLPPKYVDLNMTATSPCQCKNMCFAKGTCTSATFLDVADNDEHRCLVSEDYFSHLELLSPTSDILSAMTFYSFRNDYAGQSGFYKIYSESATFLEADIACKCDGGQLATLETQEKYDEVTGMIPTAAGALYWIGLKRDDASQPAMWQRMTGNVAATPTDLPTGSENCYSLYYLLTWTISNEDCGGKYWFVCERNF
ncbi:uncharacterized protein [Palaemon carinicauda]|uniref:uncharacterized protein n=1 Tax=Palaemon carinicauda TaxID=392227 RepID=UPI0035B583F4